MPLRPGSLSWVCEKLGEFDNTEVTPQPPNALILQVDEKPPLRSVVINERQVSIAVVKDSLKQDHEFVMNVTGFGKAVWSGEAIDFCEIHGLGWGSMGDLYRAARDEDPTRAPKQFEFATRMIKQHKNVSNAVRLNDSAFQLDRFKGTPLTVGLCHAYELTSDDVRTAWERHGPFQILFDTNPNGGFTTEALETAEQLGVFVGKARQIVRRLFDPAAPDSST